MEESQQYPLEVNETSESSGNIEDQKPEKHLSGLHLFAFLFGLGLLSFLLYKLGFNTIVETISRIGWSFFIIVAFNGTRHLLRALCVYLAVPSDQRQFKYHHCLAARLGGETVSFMSFTGPFLGEATKAVLLKKNAANLKESVSAIVADNVIYYISVLFIIITGALTLLFVVNNSQKMTYALFFVIAWAVVTFLAILYIGKKKFRLGSKIIRELSKFSWFPKSISGKLEHVIEVEQNFYEFYKNRKQAFFTLCGINFLAHTLSIFEVFTALTLLGFEATVLKSFIIESLTKVINLAFSFVPGTIGVYEGGNEVILRTLGYAAVTGITLGLVRKGAIVFWICVGFCILMWRTFSSRFRKKTA